MAYELLIQVMQSIGVGLPIGYGAYKAFRAFSLETASQHAQIITAVVSRTDQSQQLEQRIGVLERNAQELKETMLHMSNRIDDIFTIVSKK